MRKRELEVTYLVRKRGRHGKSRNGLEERERERERERGGRKDSSLE